MRKAQSTLEFTIILAVLAAALVSMTAYVKRGMQGNYRQSADSFGGQYDPKNTQSDIVYDSFGVSLSNSVTRENAETEKLETWTFGNGFDDTYKSGWEEVGPLQ